MIMTYPMKRLMDDYILGFISFDQYSTGMHYLIKLEEVDESDENRTQERYSE